MFKRGTDSESTPEKKQKEKYNDNDNDDKLKEYEKQIETLKEDLNKMRQSKIIETNQLKLKKFGHIQALLLAVMVVEKKFVIFVDIIREMMHNLKNIIKLLRKKMKKY